MFVLTVDQVGSSGNPDLVEPTLARLEDLVTRLPFTRTVGDEFQGVLEAGGAVVEAVLVLLRSRSWHIGLGIGTVEEPLPADPRSARGPAFLAARAAVEQAKREPGRVHVLAPDAPEAAEDAAVVLQLLAALRDRRTASGWEAVDLVMAGRPQSEVAEQLGVSRQAVGQRLQAAGWTLEQRTLPTLARLLDRADVTRGDRS